MNIRQVLPCNEMRMAASSRRIFYHQTAIKRLCVLAEWTIRRDIMAPADTVSLDIKASENFSYTYQFVGSNQLPYVLQP